MGGVPLLRGPGRVCAVPQPRQGGHPRALLLQQAGALAGAAHALCSAPRGAPPAHDLAGGEATPACLEAAWLCRPLARRAAHFPPPQADGYTVEVALQWCSDAFRLAAGGRTRLHTAGLCTPSSSSAAAQQLPLPGRRALDPSSQTTPAASATSRALSPPHPQPQEKQRPIPFSPALLQ